MSTKSEKHTLIQEILELQDDYNVQYPATEKEMRWHWTVSELDAYRTHILRTKGQCV